MASVNARQPFIHFFDGWRTSSCVENVHKVPPEDIKKIFPFEKLHTSLRDYALNPNEPFARGMGYRPDTFFQTAVAAE